MTVVPVHGAEVAHYGGASPAVARASLPERMQYAQTLAKSGLLPKSYYNAPQNLLLAIEMAEALGVHHMTAINGVHVVEGKPTLSAELMRALILRAGHRFDVEAFSSERVTVAVARRERPDAIQRFTYTIEDARRAKVTGKAVWQQHPGPMLLARASSTAARAVFPDVIAGMGFTPEELGAPVDHLGVPVVEVVAAPSSAGAILAGASAQPGPDGGDPQKIADRIAAATSVEQLHGIAAELYAAEQARALDPDDIARLREATTARADGLPAGQKALKRMHAALGELKLTADRDEKLEAVSNVIGRTVGSTSELTGAEADLVWRTAAAAVQDGGRAALLDPHGPDDTDHTADPAGEDVPDGVGVSDDELEQYAAGAR